MTTKNVITHSFDSLTMISPEQIEWVKTKLNKIIPVRKQGSVQSPFSYKYRDNKIGLLQFDIYQGCEKMIGRIINGDNKEVVVPVNKEVNINTIIVNCLEEFLTMVKIANEKAVHEIEKEKSIMYFDYLDYYETSSALFGYNVVTSYDEEKRAMLSSVFIWYNEETCNVINLTERLIPNNHKPRFLENSVMCALLRSGLHKEGTDFTFVSNLHVSVELDKFIQVIDQDIENDNNTNSNATSFDTFSDDEKCFIIATKMIDRCENFVEVKVTDGKGEVFIDTSIPETEIVTEECHFVGDLNFLYERYQKDFYDNYYMKHHLAHYEEILGGLKMFSDDFYLSEQETTEMLNQYQMTIIKNEVK